MTGTRTTDPGLAAERTALAWRRTAASALVLAMFTTRDAVHSGWAPSAAAALSATIALLAISVLGYQRCGRLRSGEPRAGGHVVRASAAAVTLVAVVQSVLLALSP